MNKRRILLAVSGLAVITAIPILQPQRLLAQVKAALVRDVDNPARQPVVLLSNDADFNGTLATTNMDICWSGGCSSVVPSVYRLVIEHVSFNWLTSENIPNDAAWLETRLHNHRVKSYFYTPREATAGPLWIFSGSAPTRIYADPGSQVQAFVRFTATKSPTPIDWRAFGYFVDAN
jgi:hypothetical protein